MREAISCSDHVEPAFFNTGNVKGRETFEYVCSICGADPQDCPLVADAILGLRDGQHLLPICEACHQAGEKSKPYGKADQAKKAQGKAAKKRQARAKLSS